jgi:hypothetical protein
MRLGGMPDFNADPGALTELRHDFRNVVIRGFDQVLFEVMARYDIRLL